MGVLLLFAFIIVLVLLFAFIPSLAMIWGIAWASKNLFPKVNLWARLGGILMVLLIIPQIMNVIIERDIKSLVFQSYGESPRGISTRILAVESYNGSTSEVFGCYKDCMALLLSGKIDQYLIVHRTTEHAQPKVTAFSFVKNSDCSFMNEYSNRSLSAPLENTIRELSLSGTCVMASDTTLDKADMLVSYDNVQNASWLMPPISGRQVSVSQRDHKSGAWTEIYRDIRIKYTPVFPILLPVFTLDKKRSSIDFMRRTIYRTNNNKRECKQDLFSEYDPCSRLPGHRAASAILGVSVSQSSLEKSGIIASKSDRTAVLSNMVETIILEGRQPNSNEWALLSRYISYEYYESEAFARLVIDVMSHDNFPVPSVFHTASKFSENQNVLLASAVVNRISNDMLGPEIGNYHEKQQWSNLYTILEKLGPRSMQPILDIIKNDRRRLESLSPVMCKLGSDLSGIEGSLMEMAESHDISLNGNHEQIVHLLLNLGVDEHRILSAVDVSDIHATDNTIYIKSFIETYKAGQKRCR